MVSAPQHGQPLALDRGLGTIDATGNLSLVSAAGTSISGLFAPSDGGFFGSLQVDSQSNSVGLLRAVASRLENISTRGIVGAGEQELIGGFIIGEGGKAVLMLQG